MSGVLNFFDTYTQMAILDEIVPEQTFFRDRYFPTEASDIFLSDKVITEYRKGDRQMACFVNPRSGDIPVDRRGYEIHAYEPSFVSVSRLLTQDELRKRGFGEALYSTSTAAERAARLLLKDMTDLNRRIDRLEEWMAVQTMINNACDMVEHIDAKTEGETKTVQFFDGTSEHTYTVSTPWTTFALMRGDIRAMCKMLSSRGLPAVDLIIGTDVADALLGFSDARELLDKSSGIKIGTINEKIEYPGVTMMGKLNFAGTILNVWCVDESYESDSGIDTAYFPATSAMITAPNCGHLMYGSVTQIDYGQAEYKTYAGKRIPKLVVDQDKDIRKQRIACAPLAAPKTYCPYIYAANVVR